VTRLAVPRFAGDAAHVRIREVPHELSHGIPLVDRVGVGKDDDLAPQLRHHRVETGGLPAALGLTEQADTAVSELAHDVVGRVGGRIRDDGNLQAIPRVVEGERVLDLVAHHRGFVVGRDHEADRGLAGPASDGTWTPDPHDQPQQPGIAQEDIEQNAG
jgi:hypothetical protein